MNPSDVASATASAPAPTARHPADEPGLAVRIAYGVGGLPNFFGNVMVKGLAVPFYQMTLQVDPVLLGLALAIARIWDAILDPIVGFISDRTRTRMGRRRPFIVVGALASSAAFVAIWWVPPHWRETAQFGWFLATSLVFYTCHSLWAVPYVGLGCELSLDYHGRSRVMAVHGFFLKVAELGSYWIFPLAQLAVFASVADGMRVVSLGTAVLIFGVAGAIPGIMVRERFTQAAPPPTRINRVREFFAALRMALRNRAFRVLLALTIVKLVIGMFANSVDYYVLVYWVCGGDLVQGSIWKAILTSASAVAGLLSIRLWLRLSERRDKVFALSCGFALLAVGGVAKWWLFQPGATWWLLLDPLLCAPMWMAAAILAPSMLADICDQVELETGQRQEGLYASVLTWVQHTGVALALLLSGVALNLTGFEAARGGAQSPATLLALRMILSGFTVVAALAAIALLRHYPLGKTHVRETAAVLAARRRGGLSPTSLT